MPVDPSPWNASVISASTSDTDPAFLVTFGNAKYLFNAPENLTRTFIQRKIGLSKFRCIFLSQISTETSGGLQG